MAESASRSRIIFLGATGETGRQALAAALASPAVAAVYSFGRTAPKVDNNPAKLHHSTIDFEALLKEDGNGAESAKLREVDADAVVIALGTTRKNAGSAEAFERIDRLFPLAAAKAARTEGKQQRVVLVSAQASNSSSSFLYPRSKGLTEEGVAALGYPEVFIFRPGYLAVPGGRGESRLAESVFGGVTNFFSSFTNSLQIPTPVLGAALVNAATKPLDQVKKAPFGQLETLKNHPVWAVNNAAAIQLGEGKGPKI
ncbi:hypothetical protein JCM10213_005811 [Rhodosporidiobolus nylandii]